MAKQQQEKQKENFNPDAYKQLEITVRRRFLSLCICNN
jgi:hypothetical protein